MSSKTPSKTPSKTRAVARATPEPSEEEKKPATVFLFAAEKITIGSSLIQLFSVKNKKCYQVPAELLENNDISLGDFCYGHFDGNGDDDSFKKFVKKVPTYEYTNHTLSSSSKACIKLTGKIIAADGFTVFKNEFSNALYTGKSPKAGAEESLCIEIMSPEEIERNGNKYFFKTTETSSSVKEETASSTAPKISKKSASSSVKKDIASSTAPKNSKKNASSTDQEGTASSPAPKALKNNNAPSSVKEKTSSPTAPKTSKKNVSSTDQEETASSPAPKTLKNAPNPVKKDTASSTAPKTPKKNVSSTDQEGTATPPASKTPTKKNASSSVKEETASSPAPKSPLKTAECTAIVLKVEEKEKSQFHHTLWVTTKSCEGLYVSDTKIDETHAFKGTFSEDKQKKFWTCINYIDETKNPIKISNNDDDGVFFVVNISGTKNASSKGSTTASAKYFNEIVGGDKLKITNSLKGKDVKIRYIKHPSYGYRWEAENV